MGHLNGILARVGGNLNNNFQKSQMPGGLPGGGMLKLRFDRYIKLGYDNLGILFTLEEKTSFQEQEKQHGDIHSTRSGLGC